MAINREGLSLEEFLETLGDKAPPALASELLQALWHDANQDWEKAHELAQENEGKAGAWVHAYLHRKEGDRSNAAYWYARAGRSYPNNSLADEWQEIASWLLA